MHGLTGSPLGPSQPPRGEVPRGEVTRLARPLLPPFLWEVSRSWGPSFPPPRHRPGTPGAPKAQRSLPPRGLHHSSRLSALALGGGRKTTGSSSTYCMPSTHALPLPPKCWWACAHLTADGDQVICLSSSRKGGVDLGCDSCTGPTGEVLIPSSEQLKAPAPRPQVTAAPLAPVHLPPCHEGTRAPAHRGAQFLSVTRALLYTPVRGDPSRLRPPSSDLSPDLVSKGKPPPPTGTSEQAGPLQQAGAAAT